MNTIVQVLQLKEINAFRIRSLTTWPQRFRVLLANHISPTKDSSNQRLSPQLPHRELQSFYKSATINQGTFIKHYATLVGVNIRIIVYKQINCIHCNKRTCVTTINLIVSHVLFNWIFCFCLEVIHILCGRMHVQCFLITYAFKWFHSELYIYGSIYWDISMTIAVAFLLICIINVH